MAYQRHSSYRDLVQLHDEELESLLQQRVFKPILLYHVVLFNLLPLIGLVIPRHWGGNYIRCSIFALGVGIALEVLRSHRTLLGGNGYMVGLITAWWLIWSAALLVFTNIERDFQRIERDATAETESTTTEHPQSQPDCKDKQNQGNKFHWQPYPQKFYHRLEWCAGLLFNMRGPEWNWRAPHLGPLPQSVHSQIHTGFSTTKFQAEEDAKYPGAKHRLLSAFRKCLFSYLFLDFLKVIMMRDSYFRGIGPGSSPPFPFSYLEPFPFFIPLYHVILSCMGVYTALNFVTSFNPIFFLGLSLAFPNASRKLTAAPLGEPWLYAESFGAFIEPVLDHGLAGCWGRWWHQLFRNGFTITAQWILSLLPTKMAQSPALKRIIHVVVAFFLSGFIHACGSHTQFTPTHPLSGPFLFFSMQSVGILCEYVVKSVIFPRLPLPTPSISLRRTGNTMFFLCWLVFSGTYLADDFARGGLWLMEPIPLSPLRGLGLAYGSGWWCWGGTWFRYWDDGTYWGSGIRVI